MPISDLSGRLTRRRRRQGGHPGPTATDLARRADGPQDRALYTCTCGYVFTAAVTASVGCPHCGTSQAW